jgi:peroxiredoxin
MNEAVQTLDGWYTYHDLRTIDWAAWKALDEQERKLAVEELVALTQGFAQVENAQTGAYGQYLMTGHKADLMFIHMRPTLEELTELKTQFQKTRFADYTIPTYSYFSVVELGAYFAKPGVDIETDPYIQSRLKPFLPKLRNVCFYPMSKRRDGNDNWYTLPMEERREFMKSHGMIGRQYHGKVVQIITGSTGLDDWEWGVTLYSDDPLQFKKLVYEMRFDEASARFGEFGAFYVGTTMPESDLVELLRV